MLNLTKEERNKIYKAVLRKYEKPGLFNYIVKWHGGERFSTSFLCQALRLVVRQEIDIKEQFPELWEGKPKKWMSTTYPWWEDDEIGYLQRVSLLLEAIKKTQS